MLNPGLDIDYWVAIAYSFGMDEYDMSSDKNFEELKNILTKGKGGNKKTEKDLKLLQNVKKIRYGI